jgi:CO/xanthine dehydrogenase FAD-binding subunit
VAGRALDAEVREAVAQSAYKQCRPQTSIPYDTDWRHEMVPVFVKRAIMEAIGEERRG